LLKSLCCDEIPNNKSCNYISHLQQKLAQEILVIIIIGFSFNLFLEEGPHKQLRHLKAKERTSLNLLALSKYISVTTMFNTFICKCGTMLAWINQTGLKGVDEREGWRDWIYKRHFVCKLQTQEEEESSPKLYNN